jgi:hypothetical protein
MTEPEFLDALRLLESATTLLGDQDDTPRAEWLRKLRRLTLQLDLLRERIRQAPVELQRN